MKSKFPLHIPCGDVVNQTIRVTADYGHRQNPFSKAIEFHGGIDLRSYNVPNGPQGAIYAVEDGIIESVVLPDPMYPATHDAKGKIAGVPSGRGWTPYLLLHGQSGMYWLYMHVKALAKKAEQVTAGDLIAITDQNYGYSSAIHLHLEQWEGSRSEFRKDPLPDLITGGVRVVTPDVWDNMLKGHHE